MNPRAPTIAIDINDYARVLIRRPTGLVVLAARFALLTSTRDPKPVFRRCTWALHEGRGSMASEIGEGTVNVATLVRELDHHLRAPVNAN